MAHDALLNALADLYKHGASGLPDASDVEKAEDGAIWSGPMPDKSSWKLTRNTIDSYSAEFGRA